MNRLRQVVREIHRRSLWQVLAIYLAGAWVALQVVGEITLTLSLPDWVSPFAIVLLVIGLPIVLATAFVQEGAPGLTGEEGSDSRAEPLVIPESRGRKPAAPVQPSVTERLLTWPKAILGGVAAFALLGLVTAGSMAMRTLGIGPAGTLIAKGALEARSELVVTDFSSPSDPELGRTVSLALRTDLSQSPQLEVVSAARIGDLLPLMERDPGEPVDRQVARQAAVRGGHEAVLAGELRRMGTGYLLAADLLSAESGEPLASFRATAADSTRLIPAVEELSRAVRARVGESLASVRASPPLPRVTTASLPALRHYDRGIHLHDIQNDVEGAIPHLEAAIAADSGFAMAYRKLAIALSNLGRDRARQMELMERAYRFRERLTAYEQVRVTALYQWSRGQVDSSAAVYRRWIELHPEQHSRGGAIYNNFAVLLWQGGNFAEAEAYLERYEALRREEGRTLGDVRYENLVDAEYSQGTEKEAELRSTLERWRSAHPESSRRDKFLLLRAGGEGRFSEADSLLKVYLERHGKLAAAEIEGMRWRSYLDAVRGRLEAALQSLASARQALREKGSDPEALQIAVEVARLEAIAGDTAAALGTLEDALADIPLDSLAPLDRPYLDLVRVYAELGELEPAERLLGEHRAEVDSSREAYRSMPLLARGAVATAEGRAEEALALIDERSPWGDKERALQSILRARAYEAMGRTDNAIAAYEEYLATRTRQKMPLNGFYLGEVLERLGRMHEERGDREEAAEYYRRFVELWADADPELRPRVEAAREGITALSRSQSEGG